MKKYNSYFFLYLVFGCINLFHSQNNKLDSLLLLLKTDNEDTNKVIHLYTVSNEYRIAGEFEKGLMYANQALKLGENINFKKGQAISYNKIGIIYHIRGNYNEALKNFYNALKIDREIDYKEGIASSYINIGIVNKSQGNFPEALKDYFNALKIYEQIKVAHGVADCYVNIGNIYMRQVNYDEALKNYLNALKIFKEIDAKYGLAGSYGNIGLIYDFMGNYAEALKNHYAGLKVYEEINDQEGMADSHINLGSLYAKHANYPEARKNYYAALTINKQIGSKDGIATCFIDLGTICIALNKTNDARIYLNNALELGKEMDDKDIMKDSYKGLVSLDSAVGNFKSAFENHKLYITYRDSIYNGESKIKSLKIANQYESEKKEKEIAQLNLDIIAKKKDVDEKKVALYITALGAIFLVLLGVLFYSRQQLKQKNKYQVELNKQQETNAVAIIQAQENERNSIARDLHDGVGTFLSTLKLNMQTLENSISPDKKSSYSNALLLIDTTSLELRNVMKNLSSETLQEQGFVSAAGELVERVNRLGTIHFDFKHYGLTKRLEEIIEINLYRVIQELINNCIKHSNANKSTLQLIAHQDNIILMMEDNGKGFDTHKIKLTGDDGMGLKNISNRVAFMKGTFKIESIKEQGTTFIIEIPIHSA